MKILLVTSQITYVPHNYNKLFQEIFKNCPHLIWGIVILENFNFSLIKTILGLTFMKTPRIRNTLLKNILELPQKKKEKIFKDHLKKIIYAKSMNDEKIISLVKENQIDLIINLRTRCIYKKAILNAPVLGCLNIHHGLLPHYRGTMCDLYALYEDRHAGFTLHKMNEKIDDGEILIRHIVDNKSKEKNYMKYLESCSEEEGKVLSHFLLELEKTKEILKGSPNQAQKKVYTKTPRYSQIKEIRKKGIIL